MGMQICDILEPYFKKMGLRYLSGNLNSVEPLVIFILHDIIYQIFDEDIKGRPLRHEAKKFQKEWERLNEKHFKGLFSDMDDARQDAIIDYMDDFESYISNDLMMIKCKVMDCFNFLPFEEQKFRAALETCNLIAQLSDIHWGALVRKPSGNLVRNPYDVKVLFLSEKLSDALYRKTSENKIEKKKFDELVKLIQLFERKTIDYINLRTNNENNIQEEKDKKES